MYCSITSTAQSNTLSTLRGRGFPPRAPLPYVPQNPELTELRKPRVAMKVSDIQADELRRRSPHA